MDRIKSICIEEELCQSHDGSLEQILKQMLSYKKLYNVILRAEKGETYNSIKNRYSLGFLEETDLGSKMEIEFQTDSFEILMEASYPSSTTLLILCVMPTLIEQIQRRLTCVTTKRIITITVIAFSVFMVIGRLISGVHWFTDIVGGVILSMGLFTIYKAVVMLSTTNQ